MASALTCTTPARPDDELAAEHLGEHVGARGRGQPLHRQVAVAVELEHPGAAAPDQAHVAHLLDMLGVERIGQTRRIAASLLTIKRSVRSSAMYGRWLSCGRPAAVVAGDVGDDGRLLVGQAEDLRRGEDVLRVLVMRAQADVDADVVQQRRTTCSSSRSRSPQAVLGAQLVEQPGGEHRDVMAVVAIEPVPLAERLGAGQHLVLEVLRA